MTFGKNNEFRLKTASNNFSIKNCHFEQNGAGIAAAAINLYQFSLTDTVIENSTFLNNSGSFTFLEEEYELPFYNVLTMRTNFLNFI